MKFNFVDAHCDTIVKICGSKDGDLFENGLDIDLKRLSAVNSSLQFFAVWLDKIFYPKAMCQTVKYIDYYFSELEKYKNLIGHVNSYEDYLKNKNSGKMSGLLSLEGGEALEGEISSLRMFYKLGVRAITLTWNYRNALADGAGENETRGGLTHFGKEVVAEMNRLGMIVDVSHLSDAGFWDVDKIAKKPYIASHSNARGVSDVKRNLTDEQIRALSSKGGVMGINLYSSFVCQNKEADIDGVMEQIDYIIKLAGDDCLGFGCDFDGIDAKPAGIEDVTSVKQILDRIEDKYGIKTCEKIVGKNFERVIKEIL